MENDQKGQGEYARDGDSSIHCGLKRYGHVRRLTSDAVKSSNNAENETDMNRREESQCRLKETHVETPET